MIGKNNHYLRDTKDGTKVESYSIKKFKVGTASVVIGASIFLGAGAVAQASEEVSNNTTADNTTNAGAKAQEAPKATAQPVAKETTKEDVAAAVAAKLGGETAKEVKVLDKTKLENYIAEIEAKLANGAYNNKTEESVELLKADLEAAKTALANATTQDELTKAYSKLVTTANTKLKAKSVEKKETPEVDTTNGQPTVGKKAENTEAKAGTNSIENTGSHDSRNGRALDKDNAFRTEATAATHEETTTKVGNISYTIEFSDDAKKEIYLYNQEDTNINITVNSTAGNISSVKVRGGGNRPLDEATKDSAVQIDGFGWSYTQTLSETPGPVTMNITGKTNERFLGLTPTNRREDQNSVLGERYLVIADAAGGSVSAASNGSNQPGFFKLVVKSQTYKYDIKDLTEERRITVNDIDNITPTELASIKSRLKLEYSKKSNDARFVGGSTVANPTSLIDTVAVSTTEPSKLVVTYKDGSVDTIEKSKVLNVKPAGIIPFSNPTAKEIYVYKGEETNIEFGVTDDSGKIKDLRIVQGSAIMGASGAEKGQVRNEYGLTMTSETNANGIVATTANPAITRITGTVAVPGKPKFVGPLMTRYLVAEDLDGALFSNPDANKNLDQEGAFKLVVREQTQKYDIQGQTEEANKVAVSDVNNLSDADFEKIKNNIKIQYKTSDDERLKDKDGTLVENASQYIQSITKEGDKIVVTYKDGSTDKLTLTEVVTLDKQPAIDAVNTAATEKIAAINATPNATDEEKAAAIAKVNADKEKALTAINDANVTTKEALNEAQNNGTTAIASRNPVVSKKADAKAAIEAARKAKEDAIKANTNLTEDEKTAAIAKVNDAATAATTKIDTATTNKAVEDAQNEATTAIGKVNPVAKVAAKKAITDELTAKNTELDNRQDLSQKEKDDAKAEAKKLADAQLAEIAKQPDNAETADAATTAQQAVNTAGTKGVADIKTVNPIAKEKAKKAINDELTAKNTEIDNRQDLSQKEKDDAKAEAKKLADAQLAEITKQPETADTPEAAKTAQDAVNAAGTKGVADVKAVNPLAKDAAKSDIETARQNKVNDITNNNNLSQAEKDAAIAKVNKAAEDATKAVDAATTDADVANAQTAGTGEIAKVNPIAKENAKAAIATALTAKNNEIDARKDLTDDEKTAAKAEAKKLADAETAKITAQPDNAETADAATAAQKAVNDAKDKGVGDVTAVRPIAKEKAKEAIAAELAKKESEIDGRTDLTTEEKDAAKKDAQAKAKKATDAIDAQPAIVDTEEKATAAQGAVDTAKNTGVSEVTAVNPIAVKKPEAKKAVADALKAKEAEIDARTDLTDAEKKAAKDAAKAKADAATKAIDAATTDDAVDKAKTAGTDDIATVNPVAKEEAKKAVADELAKKEAEIDARTDLTQEEKDAAKKEAQDKAKKATDAITAQPDNATTPEAAKTAQDAVDAAKKTGVDEVTAVNPTAVTKPTAKKAIEDKLAEQLETIANTPDATDEEKAEATEKAKAAAEKAKAEVDKATTDAAVKAEKDKAVGEGDTKGTIDQAVPVVEDKPNARKAIDEQTAAKKKEIDARTDLTPKAKEKLKAKADKIAEEAKKLVNAATKEADVNKIEEADRSAIRAVGDINRPIDKVLVKDPSALTDEEKAKILEEVTKVNPTAREVKYKEDGNIEVTTENGDKGIIVPSKLVKTENTLDNGKGGNDIHKPIDKVIVKDPANLTPQEKAKIIAAVEAVNPNSIVTIDEDGTVSVSTPEGKTAAIPAADLVRTQKDTAKPDAGNSNIVKPADKVIGEATDPAAQAKVEEKLKQLNPEARSVKFDEKGNATVTLNDGTTATIPAKNLFKTEAEATKPNAGNDIVKPADKTAVANKDALTPEEKKAIEDKVKAVNPGSTVVVDDKGNATVTTPEGKTAVIPATDLVKSPEDATKPKAGNDIVKPASKTKVANPDSLTPEEKKAIEDKVKAVNPGAKVVVDDKGNATVTLPNGNTAVIPASDLTKSEIDVNDGKAKDNAVTPAAKTKVASPEKLTDAEKKEIEDKVKAANPGATVVVDDKGNATVVKDGNVSVIPSTDLVKVEDDAKKENGGNDANTPAAKTVVANPDALTPAEKEAVKKAVEAVNPGSTVVVDDKGNATVTKADGTVLNIPASDLVIPADNLAGEAKNAKVKTPATRTLVENKDKLTDAEKEAVKKAIEAVNPGATVVVDNEGNATVTLPDGSTATISKEQLVKDKETVSKSKHGGDNLDIDLSKVPVGDINNITPEERAKFQFKVQGAITNVEEFDLDAYIKTIDKDGNTVYTSKKDPKVKITIDKDGNATIEKDGKKEAAVSIDKDGNVTIVTKEGQVLAIPRDDAFKQKEVPTLPEKVEVENVDKLTDSEKETVKQALIAANPKLKDANITIADNGDTTIVYPDGQKVVISATDLVKAKETGNGSNGNTGNTDTNVDKSKLESGIQNLDRLIASELDKLDAAKAEEAKALLAEAKEVFAKANATQAEVDAMVKRLEEFKLNQASTGTNADASSNGQAVNSKLGQRLANTGTTETNTGLAGLGLAVLGGLLAAARRRKEK